MAGKGIAQKVLAWEMCLRQTGVDEARDGLRIGLRIMGSLSKGYCYERKDEGIIF